MLISIVLLNLNPLFKSIEFDEVIILKTLKTSNFQFLDIKIAKKALN